MEKNIILFGFKFPHHGQHSGFLPLAHVMKRKCRVITYTHPGFLMKVLGRLGFSKLSMWVARKWFEFQELKLKRFYRNPEALVHHFFAGDSARYASKGKRSKTVITCHQPLSVMLKMVRNKGYNAYIEDFFNQAEMLILMSDTEQKAYRELFPKKRIECIRHGIDIDFFTPSAAQGRGDGKIRILSVGSWLRDYNMWADVASRLAAVHENVEFYVLANKDVRKRAQSRCADHVNVTWLSNLTDEELAEQYRQADLLFLPLEDAWANNALLEAMASGLPVVCTDLPATREYLGPDGVYVPKEVESTVEVIECLMREPEKLAEIGARLRKRACDAFSWDVIGEQHMSVYARLLGGK
jgi:glycosyltransferase involved in cell wall biosynthesis